MYIISEISDFFDGSKQYDFGSFAMYSVIGLLIVIAALLVLVFLITGITKILNIQLPAKKTEAVPASEPVSGSVVSEEEIVAAVSAAVSIFLVEENGNDEPVPFVIKSIKKF